MMDRPRVTCILAEGKRRRRIRIEDFWIRRCSSLRVAGSGRKEGMRESSTGGVIIRGDGDHQ